MVKNCLCLSANNTAFRTYCTLQMKTKRKRVQSFLCMSFYFQAQIFDEISLAELTIAESSTKAFKHCFQVRSS
jgi:hypothetical protein